MLKQLSLCTSSPKPNSWPSKLMPKPSSNPSSPMSPRCAGSSQDMEPKQPNSSTKERLLCKLIQLTVCLRIILTSVGTTLLSILCRSS
eukprot:CAMPEP_0170502364 /NCGR_PEP_ID=MMETSP0208-20121228/41285_1 /TAXON_ID=197538 /ORGANISM="Strombidium inclinatum, Strain S3" /LENGTH=87 /DNA_ID=CAMNT_0010781409 /DNA_START=170 /DNA_END=429 /DNA_ORIENTATION=-